MKITESKLFAMYVDKNEHWSANYIKANIGRSADNFATISLQLKDKTVMTLRVGEILNLIKGAGVPV